MTHTINCPIHGEITFATCGEKPREEINTNIERERQGLDKLPAVCGKCRKELGEC